MPTLSGPYGSGAFFILISAVLHLIACVFSGFSTEALILIPVGLIYLAISAGLTRGMRWLAYIAFFIMAIGGIYLLAGLWSASTIPLWIRLGIIASDWIAAAALFVALWRAPEATV
jgi:disulfide bond formation protein DsbB